MLRNTVNTEDLQKCVGLFLFISFPFFVAKEFI